MEAEERICKMEEIYQKAAAMLADLEAALDGCERLQAELRELDAYYSSPQWLEDLDRDRAGQLPADLKRGVLSEDGIYLLLERERELLAQMRDLSAAKSSSKP